MPIHCSRISFTLPQELGAQSTKLCLLSTVIERSRNRVEARHFKLKGRK